MDIAVVTTVWKRHALERLTLAYFSQLQVPGHRLHLVVVGSEGLASQAIAPCSALYVEHENLPISRKWNAGIMACRSLDVDAVLLTNSDGLINARAIELLLAGLVDGAEWVQPEGVWMWDLATDKLAWFRMDTGTGRIYSKRLLDRIGWQVWADDASIKLDSKALENMIRYRARKREVLNLYRQGGIILDIKSGVNLWSFEEMDALLEPDPTTVTPDELLAGCGLTREYFESAYIGLDLEPNRTPHGTRI